ncbi:MAG: hypothetical protein KGM99_18085 [Burkholderiales bacterium]|nr:hypothetical protein [Burkholderiales bacterium]
MNFFALTNKHFAGILITFIANANYLRTYSKFFQQSMEPEAAQGVQRETITPLDQFCITFIFLAMFAMVSLC